MLFAAADFLSRPRVHCGARERGGDNIGAFRSWRRVENFMCGTTIFASIHGRFQSDADLDALLGMSAAPQGGGVYVNAIDLIIIPSEMAKYVEAIKENAANAVKEPGCRKFNVLVMPNRPNHVFHRGVRQRGRARRPSQH